MITVVRSPFKYRVLQRFSTIYEGNDLSAAVQAFNALLPKYVTLESSIHSVTGEPLVHALDTNHRLLAVLYNVTWAEWKQLSPP